MYIGSFVQKKPPPFPSQAVGPFAVPVVTYVITTSHIQIVFFKKQNLWKTLSNFLSFKIKTIDARISIYFKNRLINTDRAAGLVEVFAV